VVIVLIIWHSPQLADGPMLLRRRVGSIQKTTLEDLMKGCILAIFFLFFISFVLVGHRCALVYF
jgi:hypothetical protein